MTYSFSYTFFVTNASGRRLGATRLENLADELMHAMLERETNIVFDSAVGAVLSDGEIDVDASVGARNEDVAGTIARDFIIESIRSTGGNPVGIFVFPDDHEAVPPKQDWHVRRYAGTHA